MHASMQASTHDTHDTHTQETHARALSACNSACGARAGMHARTRPAQAASRGESARREQWRQDRGRKDAKGTRAPRRSARGRRCGRGRRGRRRRGRGRRGRGRRGRGCGVPHIGDAHAAAVARLGAGAGPRGPLASAPAVVRAVARALRRPVAAKRSRDSAGEEQEDEGSDGGTASGRHVPESGGWIGCYRWGLSRSRADSGSRRSA
mmetsp:Transcript_34539/g.107290  ORF Transcript_34539/g.107290 Transcript_34539/m.107290 type:complete len:207 (+) Transcript_34539:132-752(+)